MSEYKLKVGDKVRLRAEPSNCYVQPYHEVELRYGTGTVVEIRDTGPHRYKVEWPKRKSALWMRNRDLLTIEEFEGYLQPCSVCGKPTRLACRKCREETCAKCLDVGLVCGKKNAGCSYRAKQNVRN